MENETNSKPDCCCPRPNKEKKGFLAGLTYGLIPHLGCIAFVVLSLIGATTATAFITPLILKTWFFYILIAISFGFATLSASIFLKKNNSLSWSGIKHKKNYLGILYGTTLLVNCLFFLIIFPYLANINLSGNSPSSITGAIAADKLQELNLAVSIPCSGHASLISGELYKIDGISNVRYQLPNIFKIQFDLTKTNQEEILSQTIFQEFPAKIIS